MALRYDLLSRLLSRSAEIAAEEGVIAAVERVYNDRLKQPADAFLAAHEGLRKAESSWAKENKESVSALKEMDQPYRLTLAVVAAYLPHEVLPSTLKQLTTDTDKINAIDSLLDILDENIEQEWAAAELSGDFGTKAPSVINEISEAVDAHKTLTEARDNRASSGGVAWERFLAFKRVVRNAYGSSSDQYRRIHHRGRQLTEKDDENSETKS